MNILMAILVLGTMSLLFGFGLSYASKKFKTDEDPRLETITEALPSANCGACGYPGCVNFAQALLSDTAKPEACPVANFDALQIIGTLLGLSVKENIRKTAYIRCGGGLSNSNNLYLYEGMGSCVAAMQLAAGGAKTCAAGCLGQGSCAAVCDFDAITVKDGIAKVDNEKCVSCKLCLPACPKNLIVMVPQTSHVRVACNSQDDGRTVRGNCKVGCINCNICIRNCKQGAIHIYQQLADIDYEKCIQCGDCVKKCPTKCIKEMTT